MGLRELAEKDLGLIMEDAVTGFGFPITITDPDCVVKLLTGLSNDISQIIDPDTGQAVSGRLVSVAIRISSLTAVGFGLPQGIADERSRPWVVEFDDINGNPFKFKVAQSDPDRALGLVVLLLELYDDS